MIQPLWRTVWRFLKKLNIELPYDPAIPLLGIYPEKTLIRKDTCTPMFIVALFTIAKMWKQPKCPSAEEEIKMWYIYTMYLFHMMSLICGILKNDTNELICKKETDSTDFESIIVDASGGWGRRGG